MNFQTKFKFDDVVLCKMHNKIHTGRITDVGIHADGSTHMDILYFITHSGHAKGQWVYEKDLTLLDTRPLSPEDLYLE